MILMSDVAAGIALVLAILGCSSKIFYHPIMTTGTCCIDLDYDLLILL